MVRMAVITAQNGCITVYRGPGVVVVVGREREGGRDGDGAGVVVCVLQY